VTSCGRQSRTGTGRRTGRHANWTEAFRGTRIVEDTRTGQWRDVDLAYSGDTVRRLNEREGYPATGKSRYAT